MKFIYIKADANDGDYVAELNQIDDKTLAFITPLINQIKGHKGDYPTYDYGNAEDLYSCDPDIIETFNDYVPYAEYGIHTIEEISILEVSSYNTLL